MSLGRPCCGPTLGLDLAEFLVFRGPIISCPIANTRGLAYVYLKARLDVPQFFLFFVFCLFFCFLGLVI